MVDLPEREAPLPRSNKGEVRLLGLRVLLVDGTLVNRRVASRMLGRLGIEPGTGTDGAEVVEAAMGTRCDVILMDVQMPILDGLSDTRQIRVIALTAGGALEDGRKFRLSGAWEHITKPVRLPGLRAALLDTSRAPDTGAHAEQGSARR